MVGDFLLMNSDSRSPAIMLKIIIKTSKQKAMFTGKALEEGTAYRYNLNSVSAKPAQEGWLLLPEKKAEQINCSL